MIASVACIKCHDITVTLSVCHTSSSVFSLAVTFTVVDMVYIFTSTVNMFFEYVVYNYVFKDRAV